MKFLEYPELELLSRALTFESAECKVFTRIEAYSCKTVNKEKRLFKTLESSYLRSASTSPPDYLEESLASPFGRLDQASARKTLFLLIATLNVAFPDHDFSEVNPADFRKEASPAMVLNSLSTTLLSLKTSTNAPTSYSSFPGSFEEPSFTLGSTSPSSHANTGKLPPLITHPALSHILDDIMNVSDCEVYTFHPDMDSDPHASAEPEEEGDVGDDDPYDDYEYWDEGNTSMRDREETPRAQGMVDEEMVDAPMFDEDVYGEGFGSAKPVPHSIATIGADGNMVLSRSGFGSKSKPSMENSRHSYSSYDSDVDEDDELDGTGAGLLWSTFALFYNRKMKRVLFVSVWSRKNARFGMPLSSWAYTAPTPMFSASLGAPQATRQTTPGARARTPKGSAPVSANVARAAAQGAAPTLAKRAIARTDSTGSIRGAGRPGHSRTNSGSPAPSSLSPFPHASPLSGLTTDPMDKVIIADGKRIVRSIDAAMFSASAPAASHSTNTSPVKKSVPAAAMRSKRTSDSASDAAPHTLDQKRAKKHTTAA